MLHRTGRVLVIASFLVAAACGEDKLTTTGAVCGTGTHDDGSGNCVPDSNKSCGAGTHDDGGGACVPDSTTTCATGTHGDGAGHCVPDNTCGTGTHSDGAGNCIPDTICGTGTHADGSGNCVPDTICGTGTHADGAGHCVPNAQLAGFTVDVTPQGCDKVVADVIPAHVVVTARDQSGAVFTTYTGTVQLIGLGGIAVTPGTMTGFVSGVASADLNVSGVGTDATLTAIDTGAGRASGTSATFAVVEEATVPVVVAPTTLIRSGTEFMVTISLESNACGALGAFSVLELEATGPAGLSIVPSTIIPIDADANDYAVTVSGVEDLPASVTLNVKNGNGVGSDTVQIVPPISFGGIQWGFGTGAQTAALRWTAATGGTGTFSYEVFQTTTSGGETWTTPTQTVSGALTTTVTGLTDGTTYFFAVRAVDGIDDTNDQNQVEVGLRTGLIVYVNDDNEGGTEDGSAVHPWGTIIEGITDAEARTAQAIYVATGTYAELPFTVTGDLQLLGGFTPGATAAAWVLNAGDMSTLGWTTPSTPGAQGVTLQSNTRFEGFEVPAELTLGSSGPGGSGFLYVTGTGVQIRNNTVAGKGTGIAIWTGGDAVVANTIVTGDPATLTNCVAVYNAYATVTASTISDCGYFGVISMSSATTVANGSSVSRAATGCVVGAFGGQLRVADSTVSDCGTPGSTPGGPTGMGILGYYTPITVERSTISRTQSSCVLAQGADLLIQDSELRDCVLTTDSGYGGPKVGAGMFSDDEMGTSAVVIRNHIVAGNGFPVYVGMRNNSTTPTSSWVDISANVIEGGRNFGVMAQINNTVTTGTNDISGNVSGNTLVGLDGPGVVAAMNTQRGPTELTVSNNILRLMGGGLSAFASSGNGSAQVTASYNSVKGSRGNFVGGLQATATVGDGYNTASVEVIGNTIAGVTGATYSPYSGGLNARATNGRYGTSHADVVGNTVTDVEGTGITASAGSNYESYQYPSQINLIGNSVARVQNVGISGTIGVGGYPDASGIVAAYNDIREVSRPSGLFRPGGALALRAESRANYPNVQNYVAYNNIAQSGVGGISVDTPSYGSSPYGWNSTETQIVANTISDVRDTGIRVNSGRAVYPSVLVQQNSVLGGGMNGVDVTLESPTASYFTQPATVRGNMIVGSYTGIRVYDRNGNYPSLDATINNNVLVGAGYGRGVDLNAYVVDGSIVNNTATGFGYAGIYVSTDYAYGTIENNLIQDVVVSDHSIAVYGGSNNTVQDYNIVTDAGSVVGTHDQVAVAEFAGLPDLWSYANSFDPVANTCLIGQNAGLGVGDFVMLPADGIIREILALTGATTGSVVVELDGPALAYNGQLSLVGWLATNPAGQVVSFRLAAGSPGVNAGNPDAGFNDPDGSLNDIGAYGGPEANLLP